MDVYDTIRADEVSDNDQILITRVLKRAVVKIPFIVSSSFTEGDVTWITGESLDNNANDAVVLWADEDVELWSV